MVLRPIIDKLTFVYNFVDCGAKKKAVQAVVLQNAKKYAKKIEGFEAATKASVGYQRLHFLNKHYHHSFVLIHKPTGAKTIVQLHAKKAGIPFMRCELNPARLGADGMTFFRHFLNLMLYNDHKTITFDTIAARPKSIKRIDIAIDLLGVDASDLEGSYIYKSKELKHEVVKNHTGRLESQYFKMPENDKNQAYWYNKRQQLKDTAKDAIEGSQSYPYGAALHTRFEYRINETDKPIANLKSLANHLKKVRFRAADYTELANKDFTHALFLRYALSRTRSKALEMIPTELQAQYAATYDKAIVDIWKPEQIWKNGWHAELISLGLLDPKALKKKKSLKKPT